MGDRFIPLDDLGSRFRGAEAANPGWRLPWACNGCKRHGSVPVDIGPKGPAQTDEQITLAKHRAHRKQSPMCIVDGYRLQDGRIYRYEAGRGKVVMLFRGETIETLKLDPWPPWGR